MIHVAVFDTKPYDRQYLENASTGGAISWSFHEARLCARTAPIVHGAQSVCAFVNDQIDRVCLEVLARNGVRHLAMRCAGYNNVDLNAARELGIPVTRVPAYSPYAVAEHAIALLLALNRKICRAYNRVREHNFSLQGLVGFDIHGKTVGIVGTGKIGRIAAQIFCGFGARVLAYDVNADMNWAEKHGIHYVDLATLLKSSDIVSLHVPLLPQTHHLLNRETLSVMKPSAYIINTSRGKLIDTKALVAALKAGRLAGVGLDVYEEEEGVFFEDLSNDVLHDDELSRLLTFPNVLVTAHQAFLTNEALSEIARVTAQNVLRASAREPFLDGTQL